MDDTINVIVQQLLLLVVLHGVHLVVPQPCILPDLPQGVVLHQDAVLEDGDQEVLWRGDSVSLAHSGIKNVLSNLIFKTSWMKQFSRHLEETVLPLQACQLLSPQSP